jgi:hypothetical protein
MPEVNMLNVMSSRTGCTKGGYSSEKSVESPDFTLESLYDCDKIREWRHARTSVFAMFSSPARAVALSDRANQEVPLSIAIQLMIEF